MTMVINGSGTITGLTAGGLPDATIQQADLAANVAGNGPAFSAYVSSNVSFSSNTWTKVTFQSEEYDTNSNYDNTTNYRFTPTVAGYYQINANIYWGNAATGVFACSVYKHGSAYKKGTAFANSASFDCISVISVLVYFNGSTDYVEIYGIQGSAVTLTTQGTTSLYSNFQASLVRAA